MRRRGDGSWIGRPLGFPGDLLGGEAPVPGTPRQIDGVLLGVTGHDLPPNPRATIASHFRLALLTMRRSCDS